MSDQSKSIESTARKLCQAAGFDPDLKVCNRSYVREISFLGHTVIVEPSAVDFEPIWWRFQLMAKAWLAGESSKQPNGHTEERRHDA